MPDYSDDKAWGAQASNEEKLATIRSESLRRLSTIQGYAQLISKLVEERGSPQMPDDFSLWCKTIFDNATELRKLIEVATEGENHLAFEQERMARNRALGETLWKDAQKGLPELRLYESLRDAMQYVAGQLDLPWKFQSSDEVRIDDEFLYPGSSVHIRMSRRGAHVGTQKRDREYTGYTIAFNWLADARNLKWDEQGGLAPSLEEAVLALHHWLIDEWDLKNITEKHPWMKNNLVK